jgi:alpha-1,2-mannosyltransferase
MCAVVFWAIWIVNFTVAGPIDRLGKIKGTDFLQFYVAGTFVRAHELDKLYKLDALYPRALSVSHGSSEALYMPLQSPQSLLALSPLSALPYPQAVVLWLALIALVFAASSWLTWRDCPGVWPYRREVVACAVACPGLYSTVLHGQTSIGNLLAIALAVYALKRDRRWAAGLALGCLAFKPHWVLTAGAVFAAAREWRVVAGLIASASAQFAVTYALVGSGVMHAYFDMLKSVQQIHHLLEPRAGDSLRGFVGLFVPWPAAALTLYLLAAAVVLHTAATVWRSRASIDVRASAVVVAMVLCSPHAFGYDLIVLAPVFLLLANWIVQHRSHPFAGTVAWTLAVLFLAPVLTALPSVIRVQCSVTAMAVLLLFLHRIATGNALSAAGLRYLNTTGTSPVAAPPARA